MSFTSNVAPFVKRELSAANALMDEGRMAEAFKHLEDAHVLGQRSTKWHVLSHIRMLRWAIRNRQHREALGQLFRIVGAATKTVVGLVPTGNTGGSNVSPFKPMPLSERNREILQSVEVNDD
ncbi:MAG: DUF3703 domain-containing protein [Pseudomonadota bacterium]